MVDTKSGVREQFSENASKRRLTLLTALCTATQQDELIHNSFTSCAENRDCPAGRGIDTFMNKSKSRRLRTRPGSGAMSIISGDSHPLANVLLAVTVPTRGGTHEQ